MSRALITTTDGILICRDLEKEKKANPSILLINDLGYTIIHMTVQSLMRRLLLRLEWSLYTMVNL